MKKVIVVLIAGFAFTYCNPSQQADQTSVDSTTNMSGQDTSGSARDTTIHPDSSRPQ